jgi:hypothetical protein
MFAPQFDFRFISRKNRKNYPDVKKMYLIFSIWPLFAMGQVNTGFESGLGDEWDQFPENRWESSPDQALSGSYSLHHTFDNAASGTDRISLKEGYFDLDSAMSWEFTLRYSNSPSSTNKWQVFLTADKSATEAASAPALNAYTLGVNVSGSDDSLRLFVFRDGNPTLLLTCSINFEKDIGTEAFHCLVKRDPITGWEIHAAKAGNEMKRVGSLPGPAIELPQMKHFMISYSYTSSKDRLLWFDDLVIHGSVLVDSIAPEITNFTVSGRHTVKLEMSENIDAKLLQNKQFLLFPGNISPENVTVQGKNISCHFLEKFKQRTDYLFVAKDLMDLESNTMASDSISFFYCEAEKNDIVISEIMADPSPPVQLRESEYVEFYNRSEFPLDLDSFILLTGKREWVLPEYNLKSGEYLVITSGDEAGLNVLPLFSSLSVITNDGQQIFLKNNYGEIITASEFNSDWYADDFKSEGGWSLERIDNNNLCGGKENWKASIDPSGGTPGWDNSVGAINVDNTSPLIEWLELISESKIRLVFSENIDPSTIPSSESFNGSNEDMEIDSVVFPEFFCNSAKIVFGENFQKGVIYELELPVGIADCSGNLLENKEIIRFGLPESSTLTDVIISEIMFSCIPGCVEYIELFNNSSNLLDLSDLRISVAQEGESGKPVIPLKTPVLFFPGEYLVLCKNKQTLLSCHTIQNQKSIVETKDLPSLPDDGACITILNRSLESVDRFCYTPDDIFPLLSDYHGVSLERLSMDRRTGEQSQWHSASSLSGFGTPGEPNSQALSTDIFQNTVEISPEIFSPNNDGRDDIMEFHFSINKEGFVGTVAVYDPVGRIVCFLGENEVLGTSGMFLWDGRDGNGNICCTGIYLIYAEFWNLKGDRERFKKVVVLVRE